jgi:aldehyde dehydrogenase (NAD+)
MGATKVKPVLSQDVSIAEVVAAQRKYFETGATRDVKVRIDALKKFKKAILAHEQDIYDALLADFGKPVFETYTSEMGVVLEEIGHMIKHIRKWSQPELVKTPFVNFISKSFIYPEPYGVSLVIGAWNYPFQLTVGPAIGAIAAGNTVIMKPSRVAEETYRVIETIVREIFDPQYVAVVDQAVEHNDMLAERYDYIFFTGGVQVGKVIARAAAEHLTPYTLELGGKSPCVVDHTADIPTAARRIAWGKFINAGQTCVAPDYLLVHAKVRDRLYDEIRKTLKEFYGQNPMQSPDYARIVSDRHFRRLSGMIKDGEVIAGGITAANTRYISPTVIEINSLSHPLMEDEIFGPVLPALVVQDMEEAMGIIKQFEKPLAFYIFSGNYKTQQYFINNVPFGGGCVNDTVAHFINPHLPFGGVGNSGIGAYHGKFSFDTFTHYKGVLNKVVWPDIPLRYPPYHGKLGIIKQIIK